MSASNIQNLLRQAMQLHREGELQRAQGIYTKILESSPLYPDALHLYGLACHQQGKHREAASYIRRAVELVPDQAVLRNNLGDALRAAGEPEEAIRQLKVALELRPDYAGAHQNLGSVYSLTEDYDAALFHAHKSVDLDAGNPKAWYNLGLVQLDCLRLHESVESFRKALNLCPSYPAAATSLLYTLNLLPGTDPDALAREHAAVAEMVFGTAQSKPEAGRQAAANGNQRIRIAYISGDFCTHAVNYFFEPVLENHDPGRFETFCYSDVAEPDQTTQRLKKLAQHWCDISAWEDDRVFEQLRSDGINVLVDLAGFTKHNRLALFARRPADCQITWLGFPNTTGMDSMDYRVVDPYTSPRDEPVRGSEKLLRLPGGFACFRPPAHAPSVHSSPLQSNNVVTLGSLHKLEKLNDELIGLWAGILRENPSARLLLARDNLDDWHQQRLQSLFSDHGVGSDRLEMIHFDKSRHSFFELFADIDILLDCFPWSGHTLACCALWMGIPVVTLYGDRHAGRMVASVLKLLGLDELVAADAESYARIVRELCKDKSRLVGYRCELRSRFEESTLRDEKAFTRALENELRRLLNF